MFKATIACMCEFRLSEQICSWEEMPDYFLHLHSIQCTNTIIFMVL